MNLFNRERGTSGEDGETREEYFLSLGAGIHQLPLIKAAARLGYLVIAVDRNRHAPGHPLSRIQIHSSIGRPSRIFKSIKENLDWNLIRGVGSRSFGPALVTVAALASVLGRPGNPISVIRSFRNKRVFKERISSQGIPVPPSHPIHLDPKKLAAHLPLLVRPASGFAKQGLTIIRTEEELMNFPGRNTGDSNRYLVEELVEDSLEVTVTALLEKGQFVLFFISDKIVSAAPPLFAEMMHVFPTRISEEMQDTIKGMMEEIVRLSGLVTGPVVAEFLVSHNGEGPGVVLVEVMPEVGGEYLADLIVKEGSGIDYFETLVKILTGTLESAPEVTIRNAVVIRFILPVDGHLRKLTFPSELIEDPDLLFFKQLKEAGSVLKTENGNRDRPGVFVMRCTVGDLEETLGKVERYARDTIIELDP